MGKKAKKSSSKSSKGTRLNAGVEDTQDEFTTGSATFKFPNGDRYKGDYCAHRSGVIWREGHGTYITKDEQTYHGLWKDDKLLENTPLQITFPTGVEYNGRIVKNKYTGPGYYTMENNLLLTCEFRDNKPKGEIMLFRQNQECCVGVAEENGALLFRENIFYKNLTENIGKGKSKMKLRQDLLVSTENESQFQPNEEYWKDVEKQVFAKSTKTPVDPTEEATWSDKYTNFILKRNEILEKVKKHGIESLSTIERKWYDGYMKFVKKRNAALKLKTQSRSEVKPTLLERYLHEEMLMKRRCVPKVFYARSAQSVEKEDSTPADKECNDPQQNVSE